MKLKELNESSDLSSGIKDGGDRRKYIALQKEAEMWFAKSRKMKDMKKSHAIDMGNKARDEANDILYKHGLID